MQRFIGRTQELQKIKDLSKLRRATLIVINGRRRIGKSRLAQEASTGKIFLSFAGLAPLKEVNAQNQRDEFARQLANNFKLPPLTFLDWSDAFAHLQRNLTDAPTVILFDEISWMGSKDPTFLAKLKNWWDLHLQHYSKVTLILCGSVSTWIEANILSSTAFFGRITLKLTLEEMSLSDSCKLLRSRGFKGSSYDVFKILAVTGGVPWYLEQVNPDKTADENIKTLCFERGGLLVDEFDKIFNDLFSNKGAIYKKIIHILAEGMRDLSQIRKALKYSHSGTLSGYLKTLSISGFISQHYTWSLKTGAQGRKSIYRLCDNYLRFFIKYIDQNLNKIIKNSYQDMPISNLVGFEAIMGFQIENLILKNRNLLLQALGTYPQEIVADNPYIQSSNSKHKGCQIDYLVQTHSKNLFICEFKFRRRELGYEIIEEMQDKIKRLDVPKSLGVCPVLIHFGGVSNSVHEKHYFYRIIDINDFLEPET